MKTLIDCRLQVCAVAVAVLTALAAAPVAAKGTLVYCSEGSPEGFQPQFFTTGTTFDAVSVPMFNRLVEFETGTTNIVPALAESWTVAPDGKTFTFKLRKGVKFHSNANFKPTRDFNAEDVLFSWYRMADDNHPFHKFTAGQTFAYFEDMGMKNIVDKVEKVDDYTVRFSLKRPEAPFLADMAMDFASILSKEYFETMRTKGTPNAADVYPIGTGPFEYVSYQKDATIRYKAFDRYWGGRPKIDNLVFSITRDATARYAKLKTGECHVMAFPKPCRSRRDAQGSAIGPAAEGGLNVGYIAFNVEKKPFDNKLVRQALNMATNKEAILKAVYQGQGQVAKNPIPPILWGYNNAVQDYATMSRRRSRCSRKPATRTASKSSSGTAGDAAVQPRRQADGRVDPGRLGESRCQGEARDVRMGRVPQAQQDRRAGGDDVRLVGRQRRSRQFLRTAAGLRSRQGRR
jgi:dipeptide transport system substrate-binding protein